MLEILRMYNINQKILVPFIHIAIILIGIDILTTVTGLGLGLEEKNFISIRFIKMFGNFYGFIAAITGKCIIVTSPMIIYRFIEKELTTSFLKNTYWALYMILIITTIITTLITNIDNIIAIINKLQYNWVS